MVKFAFKQLVTGSLLYVGFMSLAFSEVAYYRGTTNNWNAAPMNCNADGCFIVVDTKVGDSNRGPRFKIDTSGTWAENSYYPSENENGQIPVKCPEQPSLCWTDDDAYDAHIPPNSRLCIQWISSDNGKSITVTAVEKFDVKTKVYLDEKTKQNPVRDAQVFLGDFQGTNKIGPTDENGEITLSLYKKLDAYCQPSEDKYEIGVKLRWKKNNNTEYHTWATLPTPEGQPTPTFAVHLKTNVNITVPGNVTNPTQAVYLLSSTDWNRAWKLTYKDDNWVYDTTDLPAYQKSGVYYRKLPYQTEYQIIRADNQENTVVSKNELKNVTWWPGSGNNLKIGRPNYNSFYVVFLSKAFQ